MKTAASIYLEISELTQDIDNIKKLIEDKDGVFIIFERHSIFPFLKSKVLIKDLKPLQTKYLKDIIKLRQSYVKKLKQELKKYETDNN